MRGFHWLGVSAAALLFGLAVLAAPRPAMAEKVYGAVILDEARKVGTGRYQSLKNWDRTLRFFRNVYGRTKGVVTRRITVVD